MVAYVVAAHQNNTRHCEERSDVAIPCGGADTTETEHTAWFGKKLCFLPSKGPRKLDGDCHTSVRTGSQ